MPELDEEGKTILEPEEIMETRTRQLGNLSISEYLIKWKNLPTKYSTWDDKNFIKKHPELLKHCRKFFFEGEEHVRSLIIIIVTPLLLLLYPCNPHIVIIVPLHYYC